MSRFAELAAGIFNAVETNKSRSARPGVIVLRLDKPFSTNAMYRSFGRSGKGVTTIKSKAYRDWQAQALGLLQTQKWTPVTGAFGLQIKLPKGTRFDLDNTSKAFIDLLRKAGVIVDDAPKYMRRLEIIIGLANHTTITVTPILEISDDLERDQPNSPLRPEKPGA